VWSTRGGYDPFLEQVSAEGCASGWPTLPPEAAMFLRSGMQPITAIDQRTCWISKRSRADGEFSVSYLRLS
jgi:hypothetical protein